MKHDANEDNCFCKKCGAAATGRYRVKFGRDISKRFSSYKEASRFLTVLRFKADEGSLDKRDYKKNLPLSFTNLSNDWLLRRAKEHENGVISDSHFGNAKRFMHQASEYFHHTSVKNITYGDFEDFLWSDKISKNGKTRSLVRSCLNTFLSWVKKRERIEVAELPEVDYELGFRNITDIETQYEILDEVERISPSKVHFGTELLATYTCLRPGDLRRLNEGSLYNNSLIIRRPTKSKVPLVVKLIPEHVEKWKAFVKNYPALPNALFFRHQSSGNGYRKDQPYGRNMFYKWWKRACKKFGIEDLDLYGGTRHTSTTEIATLAGRDKAKSASNHKTNKAFDRYCQAGDDTGYEMATLLRSKKAGLQVANISNKDK